MDQPLVTIAIPTYNRAAHYLADALESAINQTYQNLEIIVSDNCSDDHTASLMDKYSDSRIRYVRHKQNIGANNNFKYCLENASGKFFLLLCDDDLIASGFVTSCVTALESSARSSSDIGMIRTGTGVIDADGTVIDSQPIQSIGASGREWVEAWFNHKTSLYLCSTLFHKEHLLDVGGFNTPQNLFQDVAADLLLELRYGQIEIADCMAYFRVHAGEATQAAGVERWCEDSDYILDLLRTEIVDYDGEIERMALKFFTRFNYKRARSIPSLNDRLKAFWLVYLRFKKTYSPLHFLLEKRFSKFSSVARKST